MITARLAGCLLVAACTLSAAAQPSVATWNLRNLSAVDRFEDGTYRFDYPMPEARKRAIRGLLLEIRPSILFLQEVGSAAFLEELRLDLAAGGLEYPHSAFSGEPGSRSGLAVLSLFPLQEVVFHDVVPEDSPFPFRRGIQEVAVRVTGTSFRFFHVHLKSRFSSNPADPDARTERRAGILSLAAFLQRQADLRPASPLILLGDFNTPFQDPLLDPLRQLWQPLPAADENGQSWTYFHFRSGSRERLDGFWFPRSHAFPLSPATVLPLHDCPSDHRLLLLPLLFP